jgi:hypothetical protein
LHPWGMALSLYIWICSWEHCLFLTKKKTAERPFIASGLLHACSIGISRVPKDGPCWYLFLFHRLAFLLLYSSFILGSRLRTMGMFEKSL